MLFVDLLRALAVDGLRSKETSKILPTVEETKEKSTGTVQYSARTKKPWLGKLQSSLFDHEGELTPIPSTLNSEPDLHISLSRLPKLSNDYPADTYLTRADTRPRPWIRLRGRRHAGPPTLTLIRSEMKKRNLRQGHQ